MPAFSKIGGILANELSVDEAACEGGGSDVTGGEGAESNGRLMVAFVSNEITRFLNLNFKCIQKINSEYALFTRRVPNQKYRQILSNSVKLSESEFPRFPHSLPLCPQCTQPSSPSTRPSTRACPRARWRPCRTPTPCWSTWTAAAPATTTTRCTAPRGRRWLTRANGYVSVHGGGGGGGGDINCS